MIVLIKKWSLCSPTPTAVTSTIPSRMEITPKQCHCTPGNLIPHSSLENRTELLSFSFRNWKNRELNSSWSCELQKSPNKAKISQHSRQLSGIKFMIKGYSKHFLVMLRREQEQAGKNYTCWSNETSFGNHNDLKCIFQVRLFILFLSISMYQKSIETYYFHISPSLKIRCRLILY